MISRCGAQGQVAGYVLASLLVNLAVETQPEPITYPGLRTYLYLFYVESHVAHFHRYNSWRIGSRPHDDVTKNCAHVQAI
jgi:hypothetical protein